MFRGKTIIVTGAATALGEAIATELYARGAWMVLADANLTAVKEVAARVDPTGKRSQPARLDVCEAHSVEGLLDAALTRFGGFTYAVNYADCPVPDEHSVHELDQAWWDERTAADLHAFANISRQEMPIIATSGSGGAVVNISTAISLLGGAGPTVQRAAADELKAQSQDLAQTFAEKKVRLYALAAGGVSDAHNEIANRVASLLYDGAGVESGSVVGLR